MHERELRGNSMAPFADNPFAALTIVVAPAILTNASSVLCLGTANRLARVVDRTRVLSAELANAAPNTRNLEACQHKLQDLRVRWTLVLRALKLFYMSLGSFAAAALISLFGSEFTSFRPTPHLQFHCYARTPRRHRGRRWPCSRVHRNGTRNTLGHQES